MLQLQALALAPEQGDGDADVCGCVEWLSVLAAAVPCTSPAFSAQLLDAGLENCTHAITVQYMPLPR
jgi:hypothetical protein